MNIQHKLICYAIACFLLLSASSCGRMERKPFVVEKNELYGYANESGDTVIDCVYPLAFTDTISRIGFVADDKGRIRCFNNEGKFLFYTYMCDNGPDYPHEGCFRIEDQNGLIGFADTLGNVVISPKYKFAYPFSGGKAKVTDSGKPAIEKDSEYSSWESDNWYFVSREDGK